MRRLIILGLAIALGVSGVAALSASGAGGAKVKLRSTDLGRILVDGKGRTLFLFEKDTKNKSNCSGGGAQLWPPAASAGKPTAGKGIHRKRLKTIKRADGSRQVTYYGHPLYRYAPDNGKPGATKGEEVGDVWYVLGANGKKIEGED